MAARLPDRGVLAVTGADAEKLLQGLLTNDVARLAREPAIFAGLLSPQGKILFEAIVVRDGDGFLMDVDRASAAEFLRRLTMYKLRADVSLRDASDEYAVGAVWPSADPPAADAGIAFPDPRLTALGGRLLLPASAASSVSDAGAPAYHAHRIGLGVPQGGLDYPLGDTFPHEALYDQLGGVSFTKGCYVGQEVVSRMQHRSTARKRVVPLVAAKPLPAPGTPVMAGDVGIGTLGSSAGTRGLALLRLDRAAEFEAKGVGLTVDGVTVAIELPPFATFSIPAHEAAP